jgi:hypothetical protein
MSRGLVKRSTHKSWRSDPLDNSGIVSIVRSLHRRQWMALFALASVVAGAACSLDASGIPGDDLDASPEAAGPDAADDTTIESDATADAFGDGGTDATIDVVVTDSTLDHDASDAVSDGATDAGDALADAADAADANDAADAGPTPGLTFLCGAVQVASCGTCVGATQPCVYCQPDGGATTLVGKCTAGGLRCVDSIPPATAMCPCALPDASACPESYEACHNGSDGITCRTCGEPNTTGDSCHNGGTCQADAACH